MVQKKKNHPHIDKSPIRKRKAKTWKKTYAGTDVVKNYRVHFKGVDVACAVREFQEIGYEFEPEYLKNVLRNEAARIEQIHRKKEKKQSEEFPNDWQDDNFYFIAGYMVSRIAKAKTLDEAKAGVIAFISFAKENPNDRKLMREHLAEMIEQSAEPYLKPLPAQNKYVVFIPSAAAPVMMIPIISTAFSATQSFSDSACSWSVPSVTRGSPQSGVLWGGEGSLGFPETTVHHASVQYRLPRILKKCVCYSVVLSV